MRERRVYDGLELIFDAAKEVLDSRGKKGLVLMEMVGGPISYTTEQGVRFWAKHPFQWVTPEEAEQLEGNFMPEFRRTTKEKVEDYYSY